MKMKRSRWRTKRNVTIIAISAVIFCIFCNTYGRITSTVTSANRINKVKVGLSSTLLSAAKIPSTSISTAPSCVYCESKECLAGKLNMTLEKFCSMNPRRFDCLGENIQCCDTLRNTCSEKSNVIHSGCGSKFAEVDCYELPVGCLAKAENLSVQKYCEIHPGKNDCSNNGKRGNTMLGIILSDKKGYAKFTASVVKEIQNIYSEDIYLFYDHNAAFDEIDLRHWYGQKVTVVGSKTDSSSLAYRINRMLSTFVQTDYEVLFLIDSETIFQPHWRSFVDTHLNVKKSDFLSLYHSSVMHDYNEDCPKYVGGLCKGPISDELSVVMTRSFANDVLRSQSRDLKYLNWTNILEQNNITARYPRKSLTMRISQINQGEDNCGENEVPYRFSRCSFPSWIKDGIEFFFDRCTSPDEEFSPQYSIPKIEFRKRLWVRPAISYIFHGSHPRYYRPAITNAARVFSIYPGWKIWIYTDWSPPTDVMTQLCEYDVHFIDMRLTQIMSKRSWRLLIASEPVKMYAVRDIDSDLIPRGKEAVDEWIRSGRKFHVMRDHPNHSRLPMNVGMWGAVGNAIPEMKRLLECAATTDYYMQDSVFLRDVIWPIANSSVWVHDSHSLNKFGEDHPFPLDMPRGEFVGNVVPWN